MAKFKIDTLPEWRKGQTIFNFLQWLSTNKGVPVNQSYRLADPFHLSDVEFNDLYNEFISNYCMDRVYENINELKGGKKTP